jgi:hypothetical protein
MNRKRSERAKENDLAWLHKPMTNVLKRNVEDATALMFYLTKTTAAKESRTNRGFKDLLPQLQWISHKWKDVEKEDMNTMLQPATKAMSSHFQNIRKSSKQMKDFIEVNEGRFSPAFGANAPKKTAEEYDKAIRELDEAEEDD